jgi:AcrR family transcriptional regulator
MPKDKSASHARIIPAAKSEFLEKGFEKASMRSIASKAGMTSAGLYRHFQNKEDMFAALVQPALDALKSAAEAQKERDYALLGEGKLDEIWSGNTDLSRVAALLYDHFEAFKLLFCLSAGTRFEHFFDDFIQMEQEETLRFLGEVRKRGVPVNDVSPNELHLLLNAYYAAVLEIVAHGFSGDQAEHYLQTLEAFFSPGWRAFLGF